jgi:hypothetical protein
MRAPRNPCCSCTVCRQKRNERELLAVIVKIKLLERLIDLQCGRFPSRLATMFDLIRRVS